jgi:hypothetical protein
MTRSRIVTFTLVTALAVAVGDARAQGRGQGRAVGRGAVVTGRAAPRAVVTGRPVVSGPRYVTSGPRYVAAQRYYGGPRYVAPRYAAPRYYGPRYYGPRYYGPRYVTPRVVGYAPYRPYYYPYRHGLTVGFYASFGYPYGYGYPYRYGVSVGYGYPYAYPYAYPYPYPNPYAVAGYPLPPAGYVTATPGYAYGGVRIEGAPPEGQVFVDGYYMGVVDDFDGASQHLNLQAGPHKIEIRLAGGAPIAFDVNVQPGRTMSVHAGMQ